MDPQEWTPSWTTLALHRQRLTLILIMIQPAAAGTMMTAIMETESASFFEELLKQIAKSDAKLVLLEDDKRGLLEGDFHAIACSLLPIVGKSDRDSAHAGIASIICQLRGAASQKKQEYVTARQQGQHK